MGEAIRAGVIYGIIQRNRFGIKARHQLAKVGADSLRVGNHFGEMPRLREESFIKIPHQRDRFPRFGEDKERLPRDILTNE